MMIENRHSKRLKTAINAQLVPAGAGPVHAKIRNMSLDGIFVETNLKLSNCRTVQVQFALPGERQRPPIELPATVVHTSQKGIGLNLNTPIPHILMRI